MECYFKPKVPAMSHLSKKKLLISEKRPFENLNKYVLADSGFYMNDWCFHCALILNPQTITNIPLTQHFKFKPNCFYATKKMQKYSLQKVQEKNPSDDSLLICVICMVNQRSVLFMPCCHFSTCMICSKKITECPICRKFIKNTVKLFLS